ncbi:HmuY family protein [Flexithrix dorotheae]|uniref:HmuY family protein n=1 Tax=Flexithrix dorotheae TaxID=70993 RepID=UPI001FDF9EE2|nr:HmuY family protein [Flexithrix dorotheae]
MNLRKQIYLCLMLAVALFTGCSEDDPNPGDSIQVGATLTAEMGSSLSKQIYVDLSEGSLYSVDVNTWELAFENNGSGIRTNTAKKVAVATPTEIEFDKVESDEGLVYKYDSEDGDLATTAFAGWQVNQPYIVDLGVDENGNALGKKKVMITASSATEVSIQYADLDGENAKSNVISLDAGDFTFFSLMDDKKVNVEPENWDIVLSGVTVRTGAPCAALGGGAQPGINCDIYRLTASAITNSYNGVEVAVDDPFKDLEQNDDPEAEKNQKSISDGNFESLNKAAFNSLGSTPAGDAIGRSWLQILQPHSSGIYKVYDFITYMVKDQDGNYYKVRFLAYKGGNNAENGNPTFEYKLITE